MDVRTVIENKAAALEKGDPAAVRAYYAPDAVEFTLAPPLQQTTQGPAALAAWMSGFEAPPRHEVTRLEIVESGDIAYATSLDCLTAVPKGAPAGFSLWFRVTVGLRRIDGNWLVVHEHSSVPFAMDGSLRASVDLLP